MRLQIDAAAAAAKLTAVEIRSWAAEQRVFISSVMGTLAAHRGATAEAIKGVGAEPIWFEDFGGRDDDPQSAYLSEVDRSTIYLGILGREYGRMLPSRKSATHEEYRRAEAAGLRISAWVHADEDFQGDQLGFVEEIRLFHVTGRYSSADELAERVAARLTHMAEEDVSPWCKLGDTVFRARRIIDSGGRLTVHATIAGPTVAAAVEGLRPSALLGGRDTRITFAGRSYAVRVKSLTATVKTGRATDIEIMLQRARDLEPLGLTASVNLGGKTYSGDELLEIDLRRALFGEKPPRTLLSMGSSLGKPLAQLPTGRLSVELHTALVRLLITEALIGSGRAVRVTRLDVSPPGPSGRRVRLEWIRRSDRFSPPESRSVDGYLIE